MSAERPGALAVLIQRRRVHDDISCTTAGVCELCAASRHNFKLPSVHTSHSGPLTQGWRQRKTAETPESPPTTLRHCYIAQLGHRLGIGGGTLLPRLCTATSRGGPGGPVPPRPCHPAPDHLPSQTHASEVVCTFMAAVCCVAFEAQRLQMAPRSETQTRAPAIVRFRAPMAAGSDVFV